MLKIAINGYGRIGRNILRALYESDLSQQMKIVAINDLGDAATNVHLTKYDTVHGRFNTEVNLQENQMSVNGDAIQIYQERSPSDLPWGALDIDIVFECTGFFTDAKLAKQHIEAGAKKVIISAPGKGVDNTIVYGVNHNELNANSQIISNASCTTNCLAPMAKVLDETVGIESGLMTTIHAFTNDQKLIDSAHKDIYRSRSASQSMIPTKTGAAQAVGLVLPQLQGKLSGMAVRVPTINVSVVDLTFVSSKKTSIEEINAALKHAAENELKGVLNYIDEPLVSIDFNHNPASSNFDAAQTNVIGNQVKVMSWYDNEWGFSNRMLDTAIALAEATNLSEPLQKVS